MSSITPKTLLGLIIENRPRNRIGGLAATWVKNEIVSFKVLNPDGTTHTQLSESPVYDYHPAKGSNTKTGRGWRAKMRRQIKRREQRATAKLIQDQISDMLDPEPLDDPQESIECLHDLLDHLCSDSYDFMVDTYTAPEVIEAAVYIDMMDPDGPDQYRADDHDLAKFKHASHLAQNHVPEIKDMVDDQPELPTIIPDLTNHSGMHVGGHLSRTGNVYGKPRRMSHLPIDHDANDLPDMLESIREAA